VAFLAALQTRFGQRLGALKKIGRRSAFPLRLVEAQPQHSGRLLLLGNAARTLHPVAGQGFNLGLRDLCGLLELLTVDGKLADPGHADLLAAFAAQRQRDQRSVVRMTDGFVKLFSSRFAPLAHLRGAGLVSCDLLGPLRHAVARQSMGLRTRLPELPRRAG
jgi:2-octaprenyl-6-methoxyphenol hydroxylase